MYKASFLNYTEKFDFQSRRDQSKSGVFQFRVFIFEINILILRHGKRKKQKTFFHDS